MSEIKSIIARQILDSRGNPTVEADVTLASGAFGRASVPSGASRGTHEAVELRDGDKKHFAGLGVAKAVENIENTIFQALENREGCDQLAIDSIMIALDGTPDKSRLGANATLAVSLAVARAASSELDIPLYRHLGGFNAKVLPVPMLNMINGGKHSGSPTAFQEFMVCPAGANNFSEAIEMSSDVFRALKSQLKAKGLSVAVGDEGGFSPDFPGGTVEILETLVNSIESAGFVPGKEFTLAIDCAASEFYDRSSNIYAYSRFESANAPRLTPDGQAEYLAQLVRDFPIRSIEDGMAEDDFDGWKTLGSLLDKKAMLVGDDLFVTNPQRLISGAELGIGNAILIKPNQIGTVSETFDTVEIAKRLGYQPIISHRSGETSDTAIADIAVATNAGRIKAGSLSRSDRVAKYNQLLRIEDELGDLARFGL